MKYDEPPCPWYGYIYGSYFPTYSPWPWTETPLGTPPPSSSSAVTPSPSPYFSPVCDPFLENDWNGYYEGYSNIAQGARTLYVNVLAPYGSNDLRFQCRTLPCEYETEPPTPAPATSVPSSAPTAAPTSDPTTAPSIAPTDASVEFCFSGRTEVQVEGKGTKRMDALQIGDNVKTADGTFSKVYSFGHYDPLGATVFFQIWTAGMRKPLEITADHMLYVFSNESDKKAKILPAVALKVGDFLAAPKGSSIAAVKITSIATVQRQGLYAPFTASGDIVVNGVVTSNYISFPSAFQGFLSFEQQHWLQHMAFAPYHLYCGDAGCKDETYDETTGLSKAVMIWLPLFHFLEHVLPWMTHFVAVVLGLGYYVVWKQQQAHKKAPHPVKPTLI